MIVLGAAILYALGRYTPLFAPIFDHFPGVDLYRRPADATFVINIGLALTAGYLVHRYVTEGAPRLSSGAAGLARAARLALPGAAFAILAGIVWVSYRYAAKASTCRTLCATA